MEGPSYKATPSKNDEGDESDCSADADEDCAFWEVGFLHEGSVCCRRYAGRWIIVTC